MKLTKPKKIFIVDADETFTSTLKNFLVNKGHHEVHIFRHCDDCLSAITDKPDIIILDNHLNTEQRDKASNMQLLEIIRKDYPDVHVIVLASNEGYGTAINAILHGAEQYVIKDSNTVPALETMVSEL